MTNAEKAQGLGVETFLDEHIDPLIESLAEQLGVTQVEAMAICIFSLASRINYENNEPTRQIEVKTDGQKGRLKLTWFDREQTSPNITDYRDVRIH